MTRKVLGRGLDALIPHELRESEEEKTADRVHLIPPEKIVPNPRQPRQKFDEARLAELSHSVKELGILEPVIVRPPVDGVYELVAGERRLRAAQQAGLTEVPALIRGFEGRQTLEVALIENLQREDLDPIEEARAYLRLTEEFDRTHAEISKDVGKDRSTVSNLIRLLRLPEEVLSEVSRGTLTPGHARVLLAVENRDELIALAQTMIREGWSVRKAERYLSRKERDRAQQAGDKQVTDSSGPDREVVRIEDALRYALGTEVHLFHGEEAGKIEIHYAGREELERILDLLGIQIH